MIKNSVGHYGWPHIAIHWVSALVVVGLFALGLWMHELDYYHPWYHTAPLIHQSVGVVLVLLTIFRLYWRHRAGMPEPNESHKRWETLVAKWVHILLYLSIVSMLFTGYLLATAKGQSMSVFGVPIPALFSGVENLESIAGEIHELTAFTIIWVAGLHGLAACKHHFIDKDNTLKRMMFGKN